MGLVGYIALRRGSKAERQEHAVLDHLDERFDIPVTRFELSVQE